MKARFEMPSAKLTKKLKLYLSLFLPECPFKISSTTDYGASQACVEAQKFIKKGHIKYLSGLMVRLKVDEGHLLSKTNRDFSIVESSRRGLTLFLGPGRFANHDCNANAELRPIQGGIQIFATRDIPVREEITVYYGEEYFGVGNANCLCGTCKKKVRNGWTKKGHLAEVPQSETTPRKRTHRMMVTG
jgi:histone-lysine N-methyltransferase SUV420H